MKSKSINDVIEYKKQQSIVIKLNKTNFLTILKQKITLNHFCQLVSHISPINVQRRMGMSLSKIIKFSLTAVKQQMFSIISSNQALKTLNDLNDQLSRNLTFLMKLT